jgi:hypothetical protein
MQLPAFLRFSAACLALTLATICPARADDVVDLRVRVSSTAAAHSGVESVIRSLETELRVEPRAVVPPSLRATLSSRLVRAVDRSVAAIALDELSRWVRLAVPVAELPAVLDALGADVRIDRYEEIPLPRTASLVPDDPLLRNQQGWLDLVHLPETWAAVSGGVEPRVKVAIVDGGTEWTHPDLRANVAVNAVDLPGDGIDQDGNGYVDDVYGWCFVREEGDPSPLAGQVFNARHGTHVAGLAGAVLGNGVGVAGAGGNPELILVNAAHPTIDGAIGYGYEGILYAVARGADIINCSWRTARFVGTKIYDAPYSEFEALVLRVARESGALVIAATGNDFGRGLWTTPAGYEDVLAVTATRRDSPLLWDAANIAPWVDVAAPGQGMISTFPTDQPSVEGPYGLLSGTSMASALTAGVAALILAEHPQWTVDQLRSRIGWTAAETGLDSAIRILRADALLLDTSRRDILLRMRGLVDQDGDGLPQGGEIVDLRFEVQAVFEGQIGVVIESATDDPWLVPLVQNMSLPSVPTDAPLDVRRGIQYWVNPAAPPGHVAQVQLKARVREHSGPVTSGGVRLRPLTAVLDADAHVATASANGVLGQPTQVVSAIPATPAFGRRGDAVGFLTKAALILADAGGRVSDALLPRVPISPDKDFLPTADAIERGDDPADVRLEYTDRGSTSNLGVRVDQRVRLRETGDAAFVLVDYAVDTSNRLVEGVRWGLALDFTLPSGDLHAWRGVVEERLVLAEAGRGIRAEPAHESEGSGVVGALVLGDPVALGFSGLAQWALDGEEGWNIPGSSGETVSDEVLLSRIQARVDTGSLDPVGDRVAIVSGELGDIRPGEPRGFAIAIAIAADASALTATLDRARVVWETEQFGLSAETLSTGLLRFSQNPFRNQTIVSFAMAATGPARVEVFDLRGRRVRTILDEVRRTGIHHVGWDGRDGRGAAVASGVYFVRLETSTGTSTERLTRVR